MLPPDSLSQSDSLITWPDPPPCQSRYSPSKSSSNILDNLPDNSPSDSQFQILRSAPSSPLRSPTRLTSRVPKGGIGAAAGSRPSRRPLKNCDGKQNSKRKATKSDFIRLKRSNDFQF